MQRRGFRSRRGGPPAAPKTFIRRLPPPPKRVVIAVKPAVAITESAVSSTQETIKSWFSPKRVLVKFPTRQRPDKFLTTLSLWYSTKTSSLTKFVISVDEDDPTMTSLSMRMKLKEFAGVELDIGKSKSKVEAINHGMQGRDFDILVLASDDMIPVKRGWDDRIINDMMSTFPGLDGALHYPDGYRSDIITLSILGSNLYKQFGYIYNPEYKSLWCDNEFTHVVRQLGKYQFFDSVLFKHEHPFNNKSYPRDNMYFRNDAQFVRDKRIYDTRLLLNFNAKLPQLSVLIPSLTSRYEMLQNLLNELYGQLFQLSDLWSVEIKVAIDDGTARVGDKRNSLLDIAQGKYLAFIDDDDMVESTYLKDILEASASTPDCVGFKGIMTTDGHSPKEFWFSREYPIAAERNGVYLRSPNHLCAVRSDIAKSVRFPSINFGEDSSYAASVRPLIHREVLIDRALYHYRFSREGTATQKAR